MEISPQDKEKLEKVRTEIIENINKFRWEYIELTKNREPTHNDLIILQGNLARNILSIIGEIVSCNQELPDFGEYIMDDYNAHIDEPKDIYKAGQVIAFYNIVKANFKRTFSVR